MHNIYCLTVTLTVTGVELEGFLGCLWHPFGRSVPLSLFRKNIRKLINQSTCENPKLHRCWMLVFQFSCIQIFCQNHHYFVSSLCWKFSLYQIDSINGFYMGQHENVIGTLKVASCDPPPPSPFEKSNLCSYWKPKCASLLIRFLGQRSAIWVWRFCS